MNVLTVIADVTVLAVFVLQLVIMKRFEKLIDRAQKVLASMNRERQAYEDLSNATSGPIKEFVALYKPKDNTLKTSIDNQT